MKVITYTVARRNLAKVVEAVCSDREPVIVTRPNNDSVVVLSLEEFEALEKIAHLLRSAAYTRRLLASILELEEGRGIERELID